MRRCNLSTCRAGLPSAKESDRWQKLKACNQEHYYQHEAEKRVQKATKPKKAKPKIKSIAKVRQELAELLQRLVRLKAADGNGYCKCVTCGKSYHWKEMQGGHYIERGKIATKIIEENINPQCHYCNHYGMKKASHVILYRKWMIDMHGTGFVEWLEAEAGKIAKHARDDLMAQIAEVSAQINELEKVTP